MPAALATAVSRRGALAVLGLLPSPGARAGARQAWPARPVTVIVPFPPGGSTDTVARILTPGLSAALGQDFVVHNLPGAVGVTGFARLARARPDGYTLSVAPGSTFAMAHHLYRPPYEVQRTFAGAGLLATMPLVVVVAAASPFRSFPQMLIAARRAGGALAYAHAGSGSSMHLATELFLQVAGVVLKPVGYPGTRAAIQGLLAGEVQVAVAPAAAVMPLLGSGEVRPLAITCRERCSALPDMPTIAEQGFPGYEVAEEIAAFAPAGTPAAVLRVLNAASGRAFAEAGARARLASLAVTPAAGHIEGWPAHLAAQNRRWGEFIRTRGITLR